MARVEEESRTSVSDPLFSIFSADSTISQYALGADSSILELDRRKKITKTLENAPVLNAPKFFPHIGTMSALRMRCLTPKPPERSIVNAT